MREKKDEFIIEQDEKGEWYSERLPPFIEPEFVNWVGLQIETHK